MKLTSWSIGHRVTILVGLVLMILAGTKSYLSMPREAMPEVTLPTVMVSTPYFGVSPSDIESLVTNPIEDELSTLSSVEEITSTSAQGASIIAVQFDADVELDDVLPKVRERVDLAQNSLPPDAEESFVSEINFSTFPVLIVNISGDIGLLALKDIAEDLQDRIERVPGILEVNLIGAVEREVRVEADPELLDFYGITLNDLVGTIQGANLNMPGGSIDMGATTYLVRVPGEFESPREIESLVIREKDDQPIFVRDVARVVDGYEDVETYARLNQSRSVSLTVSRRGGENTIRVIDDIKELLNEEQARYGDTVTFTTLADQSDEIRRKLNELVNNIISGLLLVLIILLFFMGGIRNALLVGLAIPVSMLLSMSILNALGVTLNIVVLFSLVMALGMLVDNAIVVVENIYRHVSMGKSRVEAAIDGVEEVAWPIISSTATTVFAFLPLMFWPGIMGEFMYYLPLTIIVVLLSSLFVALVVNPVLSSIFIRADQAAVESEPEDELAALPNNILYRGYGSLLRFSVSHRTLILGLSVAIFAGTLGLYGKFNAGVEFFPEMTPEQLMINVTLPDGSNVDASDRVVRQVERVVATCPNIENYTADVGAGNGDQMDFGAGGTAPHRSKVSVDLLAPNLQTEPVANTIRCIREGTASIVGAEIDVILAQGGPPQGKPINLEISGSDPLVLEQIAREASALIAEIDGVVNLSDNVEAGRAEIAVNIDREAAAEVGLTTAGIANVVRASVNGVTASTFRDGTDEYDINVVLDDRAREHITSIENLSVSNGDGDRIRLSEIATVDIERGLGSIRHIDGNIVFTVSSEVDTNNGYNAIEVLEEARALINAELALPAGYEVAFTGQSEEQAKEMAFLGTALLGGVFLIALVLITQFNSLIQPVIILLSVVLSLLGVLWILMVRQMPFGVIMTFLAIISLAGVVVNNAIVLIDYINQLRERGMSVQESVVQAGLVRMRPVLLTASTTALSLLPTMLGFNIDFTTMTVSRGGSTVEMWGPMANAIVSGLVVATVLTLVFVPVAYSTFESLKDAAIRVLNWFASKLGAAPSRDNTTTVAEPSSSSAHTRTTDSPTNPALSESNESASEGAESGTEQSVAAEADAAE